MNNVARACTFGSLVFVTTATMLVACKDGNVIGPWPLAPSGGSIADAALSGHKGGTILDGQAANGSDSGSGGGEDGSDSGDAADGAAVVLPYASVTIATGIGFGCHIDSAGAVWCWGNNEYFQAGAPKAGTPVSPQQVAGLVDPAIAIALGDEHACAVTTAHAVYCWGLNSSSQLGHTPGASGAGDVQCPVASSLACNGTPSLVANVTAVAIAAAGAWTCAVGTDGSVKCWGAVELGTDDGGPPCGTAANGGTCNNPPFPCPSAGPLRSRSPPITPGALTQGNAVSCWGNDLESQISQTFCPSSDCPPTPSTLPASTSVAVGTGFSCALIADAGTVSCIGDNTYGELGHLPGAMSDLQLPDAGGYYNPNLNPVPTSGGTVSELVASGKQAACAIVGGGVVECWGHIVSDAGVGTPVAISGLPPMTSLGAPDDTSICGGAADGSVWCWDLQVGAAPIKEQ